MNNRPVILGSPGGGVIEAASDGSEGPSQALSAQDCADMPDPLEEEKHLPMD